MEYIGYPIALIGCILALLGIKMINRKPNYEYEKTTDGKNTRFMTFDESEKHKRIRGLGIFILFVGVLIIGIGIYLVANDYFNP